MSVKINFSTNDCYGGGVAGDGKKFSEANVAAMINSLIGSNYVISGGTVPASDPDLVMPVALGEYIISGYRVIIDAATDITCQASNTNYIYLKLTRDGLSNVTGAAFEVNITGVPPADSVEICTAVADADNITSTADVRPVGSSINSLSNVIFSWHGSDMGITNIYGRVITTVGLTPNMSIYTVQFDFYGIYGFNYGTIMISKFVKIPGISKITIYARLWAATTNVDAEAFLRVTIGGQNGIVQSITSSTPTWVTPVSTINISNLTNGLTYDITIELKNEASNSSAYCSGVILIAS